MRIEITIEGQEPITHKLTKDKTLLGAGSDCDILVEAEGLSRKHVMILAEGDQFFVVDQGSTNGAFINEERLVPGQRASFTSFFPIRLGAHVTIALLSDEESGMGSFDFAKDLSRPADKTSAAKASPNALTAEGKSTVQSRSGFSSAPAASTRRSGRDEAPIAKGKSKSVSVNSQTHFVKILAFVVAFVSESDSAYVFCFCTSTFTYASAPTATSTYKYTSTSTYTSTATDTPNITFTMHVLIRVLLLLPLCLRLLHVCL
jgi:predicted component of type VI protein secretion system